MSANFSQILNEKNAKIKRDFFYLAGFDPRSWRYYYSLFKKNLKQYENNFGVKFELSKACEIKKNSGEI